MIESSISNPAAITAVVNDLEKLDKEQFDHVAGIVQVLAKG